MPRSITAIKKTMLNNLLLCAIALLLGVLATLMVAISSVMLHYLNELLKVATRPYQSLICFDDEDEEDARI